MTNPERAPLETATRIVAADDGTNYDTVAITLHWLTALLVIVLFGLGVTWDYFPHDTAETMQGVHVSLGVILTVVIIARVAWRLMPGHQVSALDVGLVRLASKVVQYLLYVLLVAQAVLGFLIRWSGGHPVSFFGLFDIPSPIAAMARPERRTIHELHQYIGWGIVIIAFGHAAAALYHYYVVKDRVLQRMLPLAR